MALQDSIATLVAETESQTSVVASVKTLLAQLVQMVTDLKGQVTDPAALAALDSAIAALKANDAEIASAVVANTPAA